jgi:hypothetical protein
MMEDIKEIEKHVDSIIKKTHMRRSKKLMGLSIPLFAILVVGMVVSGALVTVLLTQYNINLQGAVTLNGAEQEALLLYDGTPLAAQTTTITAMDYDVLNAGDNYTATHVISNIGANSWIVLFNLSNMPLNYVDPQNVWYGFTFEVREHGTATPITEIQLGPEEAVEFDYYYNVNALFADPLVDFPFDLRITIVKNIINTPPVVGDIPDQRVVTWIPFTTINLDDYVTDAEDPDSAIVWSVSGSHNLVIVSITNRVATITKVPGMKGSTGHTFTAKDTGGLTDSDQARFAVIDTAPVAVDDYVNLSLLPGPPGQVINFIVTPSANDHDPDGDMIRIDNVSGSGATTATIGSDWLTVYGTVPNEIGTYTFTVRIKAGFDGYDTSTLYVNVIR